MTKHLKNLLLLVAAIAPGSASGQTDTTDPGLILDHLYITGFQYQVPSQTLQSDNEPLLPEAAAILASDVLDRLNLDQTIGPKALGQQLSNVGVLQTYAGDLQGGRETLDRALETFLLSRQRFDPELATVVTAIGVNAFLQADFETAENQFRWSQHIQHREEGLYSAKQAKNLNWLTRVYLAQRNFDGADTAQRYILRVARNTYPEGTPELIKVKDGIAKYLAQRGKMISPLSDELQRALRQSLFAEAITLLSENLMTVEASFGPEALALVDILETQAEFFYWRGNYNRQQERALERALSILQAQTTQVPERLSAAWFNLGDGYVLTGNRKSSQAYASGWSLRPVAEGSPNIAEGSFIDAEDSPKIAEGSPVIAEGSFTDAEGSPVNEIAASLETDSTAPAALSGLVQVPSAGVPSAPIERLTPERDAPLTDSAPALTEVREKASATLTEPALLWPETYAPLYFDPVNKEKYPSDVDYYVEFSFTISDMGRPKRIRIIDRNVPSEEARWARSAIHNSRYRPALLNGVAVPFALQYRQPFQKVTALRQDPSISSPASSKTADLPNAGTTPLSD